MQFQKVDRQSRQRVGLRQHELARLARQAHYHVQAHGNPPLGQAVDGRARLGPGVAAVDGRKRGVRTALGAELHGHVDLARHVGKGVEQVVGKAVGARADDQAAHLGVRQRLAIFGKDGGGVTIGIAISLKISQIVLRLIFGAEKRDAVVELAADGAARVAIVGVEGAVVAESASTRALGAVAVGAGEARVDGYFLHASARRCSRCIVSSIRFDVRSSVRAPWLYARSQAVAYRASARGCRAPPCL